MAETQIRESLTLRQRLCDAYDEAQLSFTELEYCLCEPHRKGTGNYYHQYWDFWKFFHLIYFLTYHESKIGERMGEDNFKKLDMFFNCRKNHDLDVKTAYEIIDLWKQYDKVLRSLGIISLEA